MVEDRKLAVLRAIVEDYVSTQEPVGSKALVERHQLGVSPATVRNDMAALEEEGFIAQPHTSAGPGPDRQGLPPLRRPAEPGQAADRRRAPGDHHAPRGCGRPRRRRAPLGAAARAADPPGGDRAVPDPLPLDGAPRRAGTLSPPAAAGADPLDRPRRAARRRAARRRSTRTRSPTAGSRSTVPSWASASPRRPSSWPTWPRCSTSATGPSLTMLSAALVEAMSDHRSDERVVVGGTANLARFGDGFDVAIQPLLEALEEHVVLLKLLGEATSPRR